MNDLDPVRAAAAAEISEELQALFSMIGDDARPREEDGWYTISRLYEIGKQTGKISDSVSKDAFRFRIGKLAEAGLVERMKHGRWCYYRMDKP